MSNPRGNGRNPGDPPWTRAQRRAYRVFRAATTAWKSQGAQISKIELTTAPGGDPKKIAVHFRELLRRIENRLGFRGVQQAKIRTDEGLGTVHAFLAWAGPRTFYIPQAWLSIQWAEIHGAPVCWIKSMKSSKHRSNSVRYVAVQYVARQQGRCRISYTRAIFGYPLTRVWQTYRRCWGSHLGKLGIGAWELFLSGKPIVLPNGRRWDPHEVRGDPDGTLERYRSESDRPVEFKRTLPEHLCITVFQLGGQWWQTRSDNGFRWEQIPPPRERG